ncbi:MAG TPA: hypothetical protein VK674_03395 [Candidatus Limnocylindria bacterium]|nr:hypothetical protein [Candidatus Limnocylindria bacterium]
MDAEEPNFKPIEQAVSDDELKDIVEQIEKMKPLLEEGIARQAELNTLTTRASNAYNGTADHDSVQYRKYDKSRREHTRWSPVPRSDYVGMQHANSLFELQQQIVELLSLHDVDIQPTELFIPPRSMFTARTQIKNILSRATSTIDIKDDYLFSANRTTMNIELLYIIDPFMQSSLNLSARLLGDSPNPPAAVASDVKLFLQQFPRAEVKGNAPAANGPKLTHDRFIIIDKKEVYKIGGSVKDLGSAQTAIDLVNDPTITQSYITQFDTWWTGAHDYSNLI